MIDEYDRAYDATLLIILWGNDTIWIYYVIGDIDYVTHNNEEPQ
jgi:hypothetical protein